MRTLAAVRRRAAEAACAFTYGGRELPHVIRKVSSATAADTAADTLIHAWVNNQWVSDIGAYPPAPSTVAGMYEVHLAMQRHPLVKNLGGLRGYKIGAVGALGETALYAPLFGGFIVEEPGALAASDMQVLLAAPEEAKSPFLIVECGVDESVEASQMHQLEPEFCVVMQESLPASSDGQPHSLERVWRAVDSVLLSIECCGRRATAEVIEQQTLLGKWQDLLSAGGVVLGPKLASVSVDALARCPTTLLINGELVVEGSGSACPGGGPAQALTWLANHLNGRGLALERGMLVATGQTCIHRGFKVHDHVVAKFGALGQVEMVVQP